MASVLLLVPKFPACFLLSGLDGHWVAAKGDLFEFRGKTRPVGVAQLSDERFQHLLRYQAHCRVIVPERVEIYSSQA